MTDFIENNNGESTFINIYTHRECTVEVKIKRGIQYLIEQRLFRRRIG